MWALSLGQEDALEKEMATKFPGELLWTQEPGGLRSLGSQSQTQPSD